MSQLPARPDLDQLRRQARELHQAARDGDARSLRRLGQAPGAVTLSAAQLALARDYGFASWPRLKAEVERRRAALAGFLTAEADDLIAGQYRDRPRLRPVLDAVLAALPALGPVTVQARGTIVSLVTRRRTFAVVKATTKSRVDLGLRLDNTQPGGRLLPARDIGAATVRIPLTAPDEIDEEALGWLWRAYDENTAPPPPRRPARRPAPALGTLTVVIEGFDLPGLTCAPEPGGQVHQNIHVALTGPGKDQPALAVPGSRWLAIEPVRGDAPSAHWEVPVTVRRGTDGFDFSGPFVRGDRTDRHLGLAWGDVPGDGTLRLFRGAKLRLVDIDPAIIEEAIRPGHRLVARIRLTDAKGNPVCARVHPPALTWSAEPG
jgi:Family of unknown function (DUF5990)/Domain of unknown function (DUF5655)